MREENDFLMEMMQLIRGKRESREKKTFLEEFLHRYVQKPGRGTARNNLQ